MRLLESKVVLKSTAHPKKKLKKTCKLVSSTKSASVTTNPSDS